MMFMRKCKYGHQRAGVLRIIEELRPTFAPQSHAASEAVGPVVPSGSALVIFEKQRHEDVI